MRFGTVDTFVDPADPSPRMGRPIANQELVRALLTHGTWERYTFFVPDSWHVAQVSRALGALVPDERLGKRIEVRAQVELAKALRDEDFDVFHLGDFTYFLPFLAAARDRASHPFPITGVTHSLDGVTMHTRFIQLLLAGLKPYDAVVCTSQAAARFVEAKRQEVQSLLRGVGADLGWSAQSRVIPLGVEPGLFEEGDREAARAFFQIPADATIGLSVGRLSLRTKTDWAPILELLARMDRAGELPPKFILIIAGGDSGGSAALLDDAIKSLGIAARVVVFPNFPAEVKSKLYQAADVYLSVVDNFQETFGLSVIEAMASGLPVVASDFSGYRDAVTEGETGWVVPTTFCATLPPFLADTMGILDPIVSRFFLAQMVAVDLERLREAVLDATRDVAGREARGRRARAAARAYRWPEVIRAYEELWRELGEMAATTPTTVARALDPALLTGNGMASYLHFPTHLLAGGDTLSLTDVGRAVLEGAGAIIRWEDVTLAVDPGLERAILARLASAPHTVADLRTLSAVPGVVDFHLMWLMKHGALRIGA
ncbi:MAG: glycosyltransferase family 4 protein [Deltaproteobacteria bacterium]|nr:glycosyltransferase family 4 protein [Deltaproteobacteria bacterium]